MSRTPRPTETEPGKSAIRTEDGWICRSCGFGVFEGCGCDHGEWLCGDCGEYTYPFHYEKRDGCGWCGSSDVEHASSQRGCSEKRKKEDTQ